MDDFNFPSEKTTPGSPAVSNNIELNMEEERHGNLLFGIVGGVIASIVGAIIWALITVSSGYQIGWMAIGVGFLVGICIRICGRGHQPIFGISGGLLALAGCLIGNILSIYGLLSKEFSVPIFEVLSKIGFGTAVDMYSKSIQPMDFLFYAIAVYEGFKFSNTSK